MPCCLTCAVARRSDRRAGIKAQADISAQYDEVVEKQFVTFGRVWALLWAVAASTPFFAALSRGSTINSDMGASLAPWKTANWPTAMSRIRQSNPP